MPLTSVKNKRVQVDVQRSRSLCSASHLRRNLDGIQSTSEAIVNNCPGVVVISCVAGISCTRRVVIMELLWPVRATKTTERTENGHA